MTDYGLRITDCYGILMMDCSRNRGEFGARRGRWAMTFDQLLAYAVTRFEEAGGADWADDARVGAIALLVALLLVFVVLRALAAAVDR